MDYLVLQSLYDLYVVKTDDLYFQKMFDIDSKENIDYKIQVLQWCVENDMIATQYENLDQDMFYENYPEEDMWDL